MADLSINVAAVSTSNGAVLDRGFNAGATVSAGQVVYKDTNNRWQLFDSDTGAGLGANQNDVAGVALHNAANTQPLAVCLSDPNFCPGATVAPGVTYFGSNTAGGITATAPASGNYTRVMGIGLSTTRMVLRPFSSNVAV